MTRKPTRPGFLDRPYEAGDTIPAPESIEVNSQDAWEAWHALNDRELAQFANTAPMSDLPSPESDPSYAATEPAGLRELQELREQRPRPAKPKGPTLEEVMVEARRFNRVCPMPQRWNDLYLLLPNKTGTGHSAQPAPPLAASAWGGTPALAKRMVFREHLEWADRQAFLGQVMAFLRSLPEEDWYHMGD